MALTAYFGLRSIDKKWRDFGKLGQLFAGGFFHQGMAIDAGKASVCMRACCPIGLNAALMTTKARFVLHLRRFTRIFPKRDHAADALAAARSNVVASRPMAILASSFLRLVPWIVEKNLAHHSGRKFFKGGSVASLAHFVTDIGRGGRWTRFSDFLFRRRGQLRKAEQHQTRCHQENASNHNFPISRTEKNDLNYGSRFKNAYSIEFPRVSIGKSAHDNDASSTLACND